MTNESESFIRWQSIAIHQLGYAVNLILTFAVASLGFCLSLLRDEHFVPGCWGKCFYDLSLLTLGVSIAVGILCSVNRLRDFRETKGIARERENMQRQKGDKSHIDNHLQYRREKTENLGKNTWRLFWGQIGTFAVSILFLMITFAITYHTKLF